MDAQRVKELIIKVENDLEILIDEVGSTTPEVLKRINKIMQTCKIIRENTNSELDRILLEKINSI